MRKRYFNTTFFLCRNLRNIFLFLPKIWKYLAIDLNQFQFLFNFCYKIPPFFLGLFIFSNVIKFSKALILFYIFYKELISESLIPTNMNSYNKFLRIFLNCIFLTNWNYFNFNVYVFRESYLLEWYFDILLNILHNES